MLEHDWSGWTEWRALSTLDISAVPDAPGAYVIATDRPVNRAVGTDPNGFLDIGEPGSLRYRLRGFYRCITKRGEEGHMAGWRFAFFRFERRFPLGSLRVRWRATDDKEEAYRAEGHLLLAYLREHCELPPLNYKFNWKAFAELGWHIFDDLAVDA
jgi:hypothetical protein